MDISDQRCNFLLGHLASIVAKFRNHKRIFISSSTFQKDLPARPKRPGNQIQRTRRLGNRCESAGVTIDPASCLHITSLTDGPVRIHVDQHVIMTTPAIFCHSPQTSLRIQNRQTPSFQRNQFRDSGTALIWQKCDIFLTLTIGIKELDGHPLYGRNTFYP